MICIHKHHLVLVGFLLVLLHIKQTVNSSIQDDNHKRMDSFNHFRHHHNIPYRNRQSHQMMHNTEIQHHTISSTILKKRNLPSKSTFRYPSASRYTNRRIEEAVHAFHASSSTRRPQTHHKGSIDNNRNENIKDVHHKKMTMLQALNENSHRISSRLTTLRTTISLSPVVSSTLSPTLEKFSHSHSKKHSNLEDDNDEDADFYYYDDIDEVDNNKKSTKQHQTNVGGHNSDMVDTDNVLMSRERQHSVGNVKTTEPKNKLSEPVDDYNYDYLDDEPTDTNDNNTESLTSDKWRNYGTAEAVEKSRQKYLTEGHNVTAHITRVFQEATCKHPRPKIIRINEASKRYVPHCTVLNRCGDDTACCHSDTQTCVPKKTATIDLQFYVIPIGQSNAIIETLTFVNHIECHCVDRYRMRSTTSSPENFSNENSNNLTCQCVRNFEVFEEDVEDDSEYSNGKLNKICRCDCLSDNDNCELLKKGKEHFSVEDRRCILDNRCTTPNCEYGQYNRRAGRCPRMQEKLETARQLSFD